MAFWCAHGTMPFMERTYTITDESELAPIAVELVALLKEREADGSAAVLALHGDLGAGKTTFMQTLAQTLGVSEAVTSPTFVVMKKYTTSDDRFTQLVHIDAYRIEDVDEMRPLQFDAELADEGSIIGIEWAEKIAPALPERTVHITFTPTETSRTITIHATAD